MAVNRTLENRQRRKGWFTAPYALVLKPSSSWRWILRTKTIIHGWLARLSLTSTYLLNSNGSIVP
jgi:hypothetical protein